MKPFSELNFTQRAIEVLRWFCVLPVAAVNFWGVVHARLYIAHLWPGPRDLMGQQVPVFDGHDLVRSLMLALSGVFFVVAGCMMAPRFRGAAAIPLIFVFVIFFSHFAQEGRHYFDISAELLGAWAGAVWVYYAERPEANASRPTGQTG